MKQILLATLLLGAAVAPAMAQNRETRQMMADIRILQEQSQQLQNTLGSLGEALKALNGRLDEQADLNRRSFADQKLIIETLSNDVRIVRERADDTNVRLGSLSQEVDALHQAMQSVSAAAAAAAAAAPPTDPALGGAAPEDPGAPAAAAAPAPVPAVVGSPQKLWDSAYSDYTAGLYDLAVSGFQFYVKQFPKSPEADDAQVYIASAYLQDGKYKEAVEAADLAIRTYPDSDVLPEAHLRKGMALKNLKQNDRARQEFETIVKNYPQHFAATLALQQIQQLMKP